MKKIISHFLFLLFILCFPVTAWADGEVEDRVLEYHDENYATIQWNPDTNVVDFCIESDWNNENQCCYLILCVFESNSGKLCICEIKDWTGESVSQSYNYNGESAPVCKVFGLNNVYSPVCEAIVCDYSKELFGGGDGTKDNPYLIKTTEQLTYLAEQVDRGRPYSGIHFRLENDLNLDDTEWNPIGDFQNRFNGHFDGIGNSITGLYISKADTHIVSNNEWHNSIESVGLFGALGNQGVIENLTVDGVICIDKQTAPEKDDIIAGGIVGFCLGKLHNCHNLTSVWVSAPSSGTYINVGGVAGGFALKSSLIDGCSNSGSIYGASNHVTRCGGIAGDCDGYGAVMNCWNAGSVEAAFLDGFPVAAEAGGITCHTSKTMISNCCNYGEITGVTKVGGIIAYQWGSDFSPEDLITNCWSLGTVHGGRSGNIGYITGVLYSGIVDCCYGLNISEIAAVGNVENGELRSVKEYPEDQIQDLCDKLNSWVSEQNKNSIQYASWILSSDSLYPVLALS